MFYLVVQLVVQTGGPLGGPIGGPLCSSLGSLEMVVHMIVQTGGLFAFSGLQIFLDSSSLLHPKQTVTELESENYGVEIQE